MVIMNSNFYHRRYLQMANMNKAETEKSTSMKSSSTHASKTNMNGKSANTSTSVNEKIGKAMHLVNEARTQKINETLETIDKTLEQGKEQYNDYRMKTRKKLSALQSRVSQRVQDKPVQTLLTVGIFGMILGFLVRGRRK